MGSRGRYGIYLQMFNSFCHEALGKLIKHLMCVPQLDLRFFFGESLYYGYLF